MVKIERSLTVTGMHTAFEAERNSDFVFNGERHDFWELVCVLDGCAEITAGHRVFLLTAGQMLLHPPMEFHKIRTAGDTLRMLVLSFDAEEMPRMPEGALTFSGEWGHEPEHLLSLALEAFRMDGITAVGIADREKARLFSVRLAAFLLSRPEAAAGDSPVLHSVTARNYSRIVSILEAQVSRSLTLDELAALCRMSVSSLKKTFRRYSGMGAMQYFTELKMKTAARAIEGGQSVQETARQLGYSGQCYFSTAFRRHYGMPPSAYRRKAEERATEPRAYAEEDAARGDRDACTAE